jgi:serine/threonine protein kinase
MGQLFKQAADIHSMYRFNRTTKAGFGGFGDVFRAANSSGDLVALKLLKTTGKPEIRLVAGHEVRMLSVTNGVPGLSSLVEAHWARARRDLYPGDPDPSFYIATEFAGGGELFDRIIEVGFTGHSEAECVNYMRQLLTTLASLHAQVSLASCWEVGDPFVLASSCFCV